MDLEESIQEKEEEKKDNLIKQLELLKMRIGNCPDMIAYVDTLLGYLQDKENNKLLNSKDIVEGFDNRFIPSNSIVIHNHYNGTVILPEMIDDDKIYIQFINSQTRTETKVWMTFLPDGQIKFREESKRFSEYRKPDGYSISTEKMYDTDGKKASEERVEYHDGKEDNYYAAKAYEKGIIATRKELETGAKETFLISSDRYKQEFQESRRGELSGEFAGGYIMQEGYPILDRDTTLEEMDELAAIHNLGKGDSYTV